MTSTICFISEAAKIRNAMSNFQRQIGNCVVFEEIRQPGGDYVHIMNGWDIVDQNCDICFYRATNYNSARAESQNSLITLLNVFSHISVHSFW
jgi:hypothetical protein